MKQKIEISQTFKVFGYEIKVNDDQLAQAIKQLPDKKQKVILLAFFIGLKDAEIGRMMGLARSTVHYHRTDAIQKIKRNMEADLNKCL